MEKASYFCFVIDIELFLIFLYSESDQWTNETSTYTVTVQRVQESSFKNITLNWDTR